MTEENIPKIPKFLERAEQMKLIMAFGAARGEKGFTEKDAAKLLSWAEWVSFQASVLELILRGEVIIDADNDVIGEYGDVKFLPAKTKLSDELYQRHKQNLAGIEELLNTRNNESGL